MTWGFPERKDTELMFCQVFAIDTSTGLVHIYWDGTKWSGWEDLGVGSLYYETPCAISWGVNRLDVFAVDSKGSLSHLYWDGSQCKLIRFVHSFRIITPFAMATQV